MATGGPKMVAGEIFAVARKGLFFSHFFLLGSGKQITYKKICAETKFSLYRSAICLQNTNMAVTSLPFNI